MQLVKNFWNESDLIDFYEFEKTLKGDSVNCSWEKRIINTSLECYARTSSKAREVTKLIKKGNYRSFLDLIKIYTHFDSICVAFLINAIKDFPVKKLYLDKYVETIDNWASCDTLKFDIKDKDDLMTLSSEYLNSDKPFVRRVGVNICFELIKSCEGLDYAFTVLNSLKDEKEYYVNMAGAWLLSYCYVVNKDLTLNFFNSNVTNDFVINNGIQKCRDSLRVSKEEKNHLIRFKRN